MKSIIVKGAREHNLKDITVKLPRDRFIVITGVSGSGKSTLAFDTIYAEGQRRYVESLSAYARQFLGQMDKPDVDSIEGLSPAISIEQKTTSKNPRSTVGTVTEIYDYLRLLFARIGVPHCPVHGIKIESQSPERIAESILEEAKKAAGMPEDAEAGYRKDLEQYPANGWALFGLAQALGLDGGQAQFICQPFDGRRGEGPAAPGRAVGLGQHQRHAVSRRLSQCKRAGRRRLATSSISHWHLPRSD